MTPSIIYGTAWKQERTTELVVQAILRGFRAIDTACQPKHYQEDLVGQALITLKERHQIKREDLFIQTKYTPIGGQDRQKPLPYNPASSIPIQIRQSFQTSLKNLHTTYLDSYLLHSPFSSVSSTVEAWHTLMSLQDEGKVRMIGISNAYDVRLLEALTKERKIDVVQNRWYQGNRWDGDVHRYCMDNGIQYQSFWTLSGSPGLLSNPNLLAISQATKCTPEQVVYKLARMRGITPLSGTTNDTHMQQDLAVEEIEFPDSEESHVKAIMGLLGN